MSSKISSQEIQKIIDTIEQFSKTELTTSEANTKKRIIEPVLETLGWDFSSNEVRLEHPIKIGSRTVYVDYSLSLEGSPVVFFEAKAFHNELTEDDSGQIISYGRLIGVRWAALSNGKLIKIFDTTRRLTDKDCLIGQVDLRRLHENLDELLLLHRDTILSGEIESTVQRLIATRKAIRNLSQKKDQIVEDFENTLLKITGEILKDRIHSISLQLAHQAVSSLEIQIEARPLKTAELPTATSAIRKELSSYEPGEVIVCPSRPEGVEFLKKYNAWGFITMSEARKPKYLALYVGSPESSVKYFGIIDSITKPIQSKDELSIEDVDIETSDLGKRVVHLKPGSIIVLKDPIPIKDRRRGLRGIKYSTLEKMISAESISDL